MNLYNTICTVQYKIIIDWFLLIQVVQFIKASREIHSGELVLIVRPNGTKTFPFDFLGFFKGGVKIAFQTMPLLAAV